MLAALGMLMFAGLASRFRRVSSWLKLVGLIIAHGRGIAFAGVAVKYTPLVLVAMAVIRIAMYFA